MKATRSRVTLALCAAAALIAGGVLIATWSSSSPLSAAAVQPLEKDLHHARALSQAFREVAKVMRPSVVSVSSERTIQPAQLRGNVKRPEIPKEFRRFFDDDTFDRFFKDVPSHPYTQRGLGSGVIVSKSGYVVTNNHVVRGADKVRVTLHDRRSFPAKVVGTDPKTDVAVLKIEAADLVPAKLGDSDKMEVGDWVLAMGSPFHLTQTVTAGIISAKGRGNVGITDYEDFLQTDAAINPGNSGGPLVNLRGEVVGINTAIASNTGTYMGVGFSIPSNMVKYVMKSLINTGHVERGRIGAGIQDLTQDLARSFGYKFNGSGVLVGDVIAGGPADKAGLKSGDIVVALNDRPMRNAAQLRNTVAGTKPGTDISLRVFRKGEYHDLKVTIGRLTESQTVAQAGPAGSAEVKSEDLGMTLHDASSELAKKLDLAEGTKGAVVTGLDSDSIAAAASIRVGDVIVAVGNQPVTDVASFRKAMKSQDLSKGIRLQVLSKGLKRFVFVQKS